MSSKVVEQTSNGALRRGSNGTAPVDAFEQHRQLRRTQGHRAMGRLGPHELARFEPLGEQTQPVTIPPQEFHPITATAAKDEDLAREGIGLQFRLHECSQPVEPAPHVGDPRSDPDAGTGRRPDHRSSAART